MRYVESKRLAMTAESLNGYEQSTVKFISHYHIV